MFTGLIEYVGEVKGVEQASGGGARMSVDLGPLAAGTGLGDSIAIDGCCLTVANLDGTQASFDAVPETLLRTTLGKCRAGSQVNLERAVRPDQRLGGHFVQGHVDGSARVEKTVEGERWAEWHFRLEDQGLAIQIVEKGSIAIDGISLTVAGCDGKGSFWVAVIPETLKRTTIGKKRDGCKVNVETDILGKYVQAMLSSKAHGEVDEKSNISEAWLRERGFS